MMRFPRPAGIVCNMMPYVQGDSSSVPAWLEPYAHILDDYTIERGSVGHVTVQESVVRGGSTQRGYSRMGASRNVHIEVGRDSGAALWGGGHWGDGSAVTLELSTRVLVANSVPDTCRTWDCVDDGPTPDGDLGARLHLYPPESGRMMGAGEVREIGILTPHECVPQNHTGWRQFLRIVGSGVDGRESHFTPNERLGR